MLRIRKITRSRTTRAFSVEHLEPRIALSNYYVSPLGNDSAAGTGTAPWKTLQKAANVVQAGDLVTVRAGTYAGFDLRKDGTASARITFRAEPGVTINARNARTPDGINLEGADYVTIEGFRLVGLPRAGIRSVLNKNVTIRNNVADQNYRWGIFTGFSNDLLIEGNTTSRSQVEHGIYVSNSGDRPVIRNNLVFSNYANGIHMNGDVSMGGDGIITGALVENNTIHDNGRGGGSAINADGVQSSRIQNNLIYNTHASGISLYRIDGGGASTNNVVINNTVHVASGGRWALNIANRSTGNTAYNNILLNDHSYRGSISISTDSLSGFKSNYNVVMDRFSRDGGSSRIGRSAWTKATGQDANSVVATASQLFVNPTARDYRLKAGSPAIDRGTSLLAPPRDKNGRIRADGTLYDIGCFVYVATA